jgi:hypothetical protein
VVVAAGFGARRAGKAGPALAAALAAIGVVAVVEVAADPQLQRYDFRGAARRIGPGERAIVVTPAGGRGPLAAYLPGTRQLPFGARVREVVLLGMYARDGSGRSRVAGGRPAPPIPGFTRVVQRIDTRTYTLIRLRAPAPRPVDPVLLRTRGLGSAETTALLEP